MNVNHPVVKMYFHMSLSGFSVKDVHANCFCATLLRTQIHCHIIHRACALNTKVNNDRADGHC